MGHVMAVGCWPTMTGRALPDDAPASLHRSNMKDVRRFQSLGRYVAVRTASSLTGFRTGRTHNKCGEGRPVRNSLAVIVDEVSPCLAACRLRGRPCSPHPLRAAPLFYRRGLLMLPGTRCRQSGCDRDGRNYAAASYWCSDHVPADRATWGWTCPRCGQSFQSPPSWHDCIKIDVEGSV